MTKVHLKYRPSRLDHIELNDNQICESIRDDIRKYTTIRYLIVGPGDCCKSTLADCIVNEYYSERFSTVKLGEKWKYVYRFNMMVDLDWGDDSNEMMTFCKNQSTIKKTVIIDNFEKLTDSQQQIMKRVIDKFQNKTNFIFITNEIKLIKNFIQTRTKTILLNHLNRDVVVKIMKNICIQEKLGLDDNFKNHYIMNYCDKTISYYLNIINRAILTKLTRIDSNTVSKLITDIPYEDLNDYLCKLEENRFFDALNIIYSFYDMGYDICDIYLNIYNFVNTNNHQYKFEIVDLVAKYTVMFHDGHYSKMMLVFFSNEILKLMVC